MNPIQTTALSLLWRVRDPSDHAAWREFDRRYRELLVRFCRRRGVPHMDAEDLVQRVFLGLSKTLPHFTYDPNRGRFRDYLFRCIRNAISEWASGPNRRLDGLDSSVGATRPQPGVAPPEDPSESSEWEAEWVAHHYRLALETVRQTFDAQSVDIFNRSIAGAKVADLARELGMTEEAVYKVRQRIRDRMEELIAHQIREEDRV